MGAVRLDREAYHTGGGNGDAEVRGRPPSAPEAFAESCLSPFAWAEHGCEVGGSLPEFSFSRRFVGDRFWV